MTDFNTWWKQEGSAVKPTKDEDIEEFAKRITAVAWSNSTYKAVQDGLDETNAPYGYKAVLDKPTTNTCEGCEFNYDCNTTHPCNGEDRVDKQDVIFVRKDK